MSEFEERVRTAMGELEIRRTQDCKNQPPPYFMSEEW